MGRGGRMRSTEIIITDDAGASIKATWFNQPFITKALPTDAQVALAGRVTNFRGRPVFQNPEFEIVKENSDGTHTGRLVPDYPLTKALAQRTLRNFLSNEILNRDCSANSFLILILLEPPRLICFILFAFFSILNIQPLLPDLQNITLNLFYY